MLEQGQHRVAEIRIVVDDETEADDARAKWGIEKGWLRVGRFHPHVGIAPPCIGEVRLGVRAQQLAFAPKGRCPIELA